MVNPLGRMHIQSALIQHVGTVRHPHILLSRKHPKCQAEIVLIAVLVASAENY
jgi:hypothetical protein